MQPSFMSFRSKNSLGDAGGICLAYVLYFTQRARRSNEREGASSDQIFFFSQRRKDATFV